MANSYVLKDKSFSVGDTIAIKYRIKEDGKDRQQEFKVLLIQVKGKTLDTKTFTTRKVTRSGIGVERIIPLNSPNLVEVKLVKKGTFKKAKLYFVRNLSEKEIRHKIYRQKMTSGNLTTGKIGESLATRYLQNKIHFIEVKTRTSIIKGKPYEAVRKWKIAHLLTTANFFLLQSG